MAEDEGTIIWSWLIAVVVLGVPLYLVTDPHTGHLVSGAVSVLFYLLCRDAENRVIAGASRLALIFGVVLLVWFAVDVFRAE